MPKINVDSTITIQDPALVSRKRVYPEVLLRNRKIQKSSSTVKSKDATYYTDEFETTTNKYIEIFTNIVAASGNIGEIQFNNVTFSSDPDLTWQGDNLLNIVGDLHVEDTLNTDAIKTTSLTFKVNSNTWSFDSSGSFHLPNYTIPGVDGEDLQTLIVDGTGNLNWQPIASSYDSIAQLNASTGVVIHDFSLAQVFYHTNIQSNFTTNVVNLNLENNSGTNIHLILVQSSAPYICSALQINGVDQVINWVGGILPAPNNNFVEILSFSITRINSVYTVYAQLLSYG